MTPLFETAALANVRVILSGLCANSPTPLAYPHPEAWPVLDALLASFGSEQRLWRSPFPRRAEIAFRDAVDSRVISRGVIVRIR